jgi:hypothetical protein
MNGLGSTWVFLLWVYIVGAISFWWHDAGLWFSLIWPWQVGMLLSDGMWWMQ